MRTALGHVTIMPKGDWSSSKTYTFLDVVFYSNNGSSASYIAKKNVPAGTTLTNDTYWMKLVEATNGGVPGEAAGFAEPTASATILPFGTNPTVNVTGSGPNTEKVFHFDFGIPAGPAGSTGPIGPTGEKGEKGADGTNGVSAGFGIPRADATALTPNSSPTVSINSSGGNTDKIFHFHFGIPRGATGPQGPAGPQGPIGPSGSGDYLPLSGGTLTGNLLFSDTAASSKEINFTTGGSDYAKIIGGATTTSDSGGGYLELRTGDNGNESIYVTQYNGTTRKNLLYLLNSEGNTIIPNNLSVNKTLSAVTLNLTNPLSTDYGGTGATTPALARVNLGITAIATRPNYIYQNTDPGAGSALETGTLLFVYED